LSEDSIFREVDEEVRHEQLQKLWEKYGIYVIAACLGVVVAVGGIKSWQWWQTRQAESAGARYLQAVDLLAEEQTGEANAIFEDLAENGPDGYAMLSRFQTADALATAGETAAAIAMLERITAGAGSDDLLGQLAIVKSALLSVETASLAEIEAQLGDLASEEGPWLNSAREIIALAAFREGDYERADRLYLDIRSDAEAPNGVQDRARRMQDLIEPHLQSLADASDDGSQESAVE